MNPSLVKKIIERRIVVVEGVSFRRLCNRLAEYPDVTFTHRRRFFWSALDVGGEFVFRGHPFKIEAVDVNRSFAISPKDEEAKVPEMIAELGAHVAKLT